MKSKYHINAPEGPKWYRCRRVEFVQETVTWELSRRSEYGLLAAYQMAPHRQLIKATDDNSLRVFVKAWGPLRIALDAWKGSDSIAFYRNQRDLLRAWALLFSTIQEGHGLREAAIDLLKLDSEPYGILIRSLLGIPKGLKPSLDEAELSRLANVPEVEFLKVCDYLVGSFVVPAPSLEIRKKGKETILCPTLGIYSIIGALHWMCWQDVFAENPFQKCAERNCGRFIDFTTGHDRKFCSPEHAHRWAARESAKRKRQERRDANGTQKTR